MKTRARRSPLRAARARRPMMVLLMCAVLGPAGPVSAGPVPGATPPPTEGTPTGGADQEAAPTRVLVLPALVSGELPPSTGTEVRTLVVDELTAEGITTLPADASPAACDAVCRSAAARAAGAEYVAQAQVVGDEDEFTVTVTLYGADGDALAPFGSECSICGLVEVRDMTRLAALDARTEVLRRRRDRAPAPAPPVPLDAAVRPILPRSPLVPAGWGLVGAGAAATLGGVVLLALHHRSAGCLDNPRGGDCVPLRYTTAIPGAAVLGVGVVAAVGGVVMVVLGRRAERRQAERTVAVQPLGAGLRVRF